jgi:hypothetical protein
MNPSNILEAPIAEGSDSENGAEHAASEEYLDWVSSVIVQSLKIIGNFKDVIRTLRSYTLLTNPYMVRRFVVADPKLESEDCGRTLNQTIAKFLNLRVLDLNFKVSWSSPSTSTH